MDFRKWCLIVKPRNTILEEMHVIGPCETADECQAIWAKNFKGRICVVTEIHSAELFPSK